MTDLQHLKPGGCADGMVQSQAQWSIRKQEFSFKVGAFAEDLHSHIANVSATMLVIKCPLS